MALDSNLNNHIRRLRKRVRLLLVERYGLFGTGAGMVVSAALILLSTRFEALLDNRLWAGAIPAGSIAGCAFGLARRLDDLTVARSADKRTGLKERVSTAVTLAGVSNLQDMEKALIRDAASHVEGFSAGKVFRHRFGRPHAVFGVALVLLLGAIFGPQFPAFQSKERRQEIAIMKKEGVKITRVAKEIGKQAKPSQEELKKMAKRLEQLGRKMESGRMDRKQAMLKTQRLTKEIKEQQDRLAQQSARSKPMAEARTEIREASRELANQVASRIAKTENISQQEAMGKLASDKRLTELARKDGPLTASELNELEQAISKYANPGANLPIPPELAEALAKLAENKDYRKAMELMQKLAQKLGQGNMSELDRELLKKQLEQLAKALQGTDLDKLAKMMLENAKKLAQMSPEELEKLIKDMQMMNLLAKAGGT